MMQRIKTLGVLGVVLGLIVSLSAPFGRVFAEGSGEYAVVRLRGANSVESDAQGLYGVYDGGTVRVTDSGAVAEEVAWNYGDYTGTIWQVKTKNNAMVLTANLEAGRRVEARVGGEVVGLNDNSYALIGLKAGDEYDVEFSFMYDDEPGHPGGEEFGEVEISGCDEFEDGCRGIVTGEGDETVRLRLETLWHKRFGEEFKVNGSVYVTSDYIDYSDQEDYLEHYSGQIVGFEVEVPKASDGKYVVETGTERMEQDWVGNFLWTADPAQEFERDPEGELILDENGQAIPGRNYIGHSQIELVAVEYTVGEADYACDQNTGKCEWKDRNGVKGECAMGEEGCMIPYIEFEQVERREGFSEGSLVLPAGARITLRVVPEYGYQVLNVNMAELQTRDGVGEFSFVVPGGAAYFVADVVEAEDSAKIESTAVSEGKIELGEGQTSLTAGTARLEVSDVSVEGTELSEFTEAAGEYGVKRFLNISLSNIVYKGSEDEAWEEEVKELNEEATIVLKLEEGVEGDEVVIVHQKDDGSYEVIPVEYDAETRTVRFKTSSFSKYALASKTSAGSPETGRASRDGGFVREVSGVVGGAFAMVGLGCMCAVRKRRG